jgi:pyridoxamine 5'-phosphate oxidase
LQAQPLLEPDLDPQPLRQFERWFAAAREAGIRVPEAVALATATAGGRPSARMVLLKGFGADGFVFYTSYESRKAHELTENPRAALLFHWDVLGRQVRIEGPVNRVSRAESESYFGTRPRGSQIGAWASPQSKPIAGRNELEAEARRVAERFAGVEVPAPPRWGGYRLTPESYEFWQHRDDRLHDRLRYLPDGTGGWSVSRLGP